MWEPRRLTTLWAFTACYRESFTFFYLLLKNRSPRIAGSVKWKQSYIKYAGECLRSDSIFRPRLQYSRIWHRVVGRICVCRWECPISKRINGLGMNKIWSRVPLEPEIKNCAGEDKQQFTVMLCNVPEEPAASIFRVPQNIPVDSHLYIHHRENLISLGRGRRTSSSNGRMFFRTGKSSYYATVETNVFLRLFKTN
jgi:hypothetical protein